MGPKKGDTSTALLCQRGSLHHPFPWSQTQPFTKAPASLNSSGCNVQLRFQVLLKADNSILISFPLTLIFCPALPPPPPGTCTCSTGLGVLMHVDAAHVFHSWIVSMQMTKLETPVTFILRQLVWQAACTGNPEHQHYGRSSMLLQWLRGAWAHHPEIKSRKTAYVQCWNQLVFTKITIQQFMHSLPQVRQYRTYDVNLLSQAMTLIE